MSVTKVKKTTTIEMRTLPFALGCPKCTDGGFRTVSYTNERVIVQHIGSKSCENNGKMYKFAPTVIHVEEL